MNGPATLTRGAARRLFVGVLVTWLAPVGVLHLYLAAAELRPPWDALTAGDPIQTLYVLCSALAAAAWVTRRYRMLSRQDDAGAAPEGLRREVRRLLVQLTAAVFAYVAVGDAMAVLLLSPGASWGATDLAIMGVLVFVIAGFVALPMMIVVLDEFGLRFGHLVEDRPVAPLWVRGVQGVVLSLTLAAAFLVGEYARTGAVPASSWVLVGLMVPYALAVMQLNLRYTRNALGALESFVDRARRRAEVDPAELRPEALDEVGVLHRGLAELYRRLETTRRQLEESEARLHLFADAASDWYVEFDGQLRVRWLSERFRFLAGTASEAILGRSLLEIPGADDPAWREMHEAMQARRPIRGVRASIRNGQGRRVVVESSALPRFAEDGRFLGYLGACSDVTDVVEAQEALLDRETQLAQAQKMEAVGQLTGGIAHDFNNLLMAVAGNLELARLEDPRLEENELIESALGAANRGASLVQRLLAFSRRQELRPAALDLPAKLRELTPLLRTTLGETIALELCLDEELPPPRVDAAQFESALLNLAINARDAMSDGGRLRIQAEAATVAREEGELAPGPYVTLTVEDTGSGIPEDVLSRVFEPFFSTKPVGQGSGLGLSMVYGFARQSGGTVRIASDPGRGTRVTLWLPVAEVQPETRPAAAEAPAASPVDHALLLVEDDEGVRTVLAGALRRAGFRVTVAVDGPSAREAFRDGHFDLLVSDVVLPGEDTGVELVRGFRAACPALRCVLMTGYAREHLAGAEDWIREIPLLAKPFQIDELLTVLRRELAMLEAPPREADRS
jgi:PAS domain S-box-containing protein